MKYNVHVHLSFVYERKVVIVLSGQLVLAQFPPIHASQPSIHPPRVIRTCLLNGYKDSKHTQACMLETRG